MKHLIIAVFCFLSVVRLLAQNETMLFGSKEQYTRADSLRGFLYPERSCYDVTFYDLHLTLDVLDKTIEGYNDIHFRLLQPSKRIQIDLFANLDIDSLVWNGQKCAYAREHNAVFVTIPPILPSDKHQTLRCYYHGSPTIAKRAPWDGGFVWKKDSNGKDFISVACQGIGASIWFPNKDHQSDEPDSMRFSCAVPSDLVCVSNGRLMNKKTDKGNMRYTWQTHYPINNYAISFYVGDFVLLQDHYISGQDSLDLNYYVLSDNRESAQKQFAQVKPMLQCFEKYLGRFPFWRDGYKLVEAPYLGMEHQTAIAYGNNFVNGYLGMDLTRTGIGKQFDYIIIHETGHEWWGNNVTTKDIADMWVHESFCTYSESLYVECMFGEEAAQRYVNGYQGGVDNDRPIIGDYDVNHEGSGDMYGKGALILNTLRHQIGDDNLWFSILKGINQRFAMQTTTSKAVIDYINERTGQNYTPFFRQYLEKAQPPILRTETTQINKKRWKISYHWENANDDFNLPIEANINGKTQKIVPNNTWQSIVVDAKKSPTFDCNTNKAYYLLNP
ncbi:MAG: M1 family metallopeptidase [Chitinophagales bacterium]|nr:M1 family metallopeptidase [Chitinophagales bacterium]